MNKRIASLAIACLCMTTLASASQPAKPRSPFLGKWALDLKSMPVTYGAPPESVTYEFVDLGNGRWETRIHIVDKGHGVRDIAVSYRRDGQTGRMASMIWLDR